MQFSLCALDASTLFLSLIMTKYNLPNCTHTFVFFPLIAFLPLWTCLIVLPNFAFQSMGENMLCQSRCASTNNLIRWSSQNGYRTSTFLQSDANETQSNYYVLIFQAFTSLTIQLSSSSLAHVCMPSNNPCAQSGEHLSFQFLWMEYISFSSNDSNSNGWNGACTLPPSHVIMK